MAGRSVKVAAALLPLLFGACASPPPPDSLSAARVQVGQATAPVPEAQVYLQSAREKLAAAERAAAGEDMVRADLLAREALADVNVAQATVQAAQAEAAVEDVEKAIQALRAETAPRTASPAPVQPRQ